VTVLPSILPDNALRWGMLVFSTMVGESMFFNDVYDEHKKRLAEAKSQVDESFKKLRTFLLSHQDEVQEAVGASARKVVLADTPAGSIDQNGMKFEWKFWNGIGHYNNLRDESSLSLHAKLEWLPSSHNVIRTSGSGITAADIDLDDFIATPLVECMEMMMSEALLAHAKSKFPHIT